MIEYSYQNALSFSYETAFSEKVDGRELSFALTRCNRALLPFKEECVQTARLFQQQAEMLNRPIYLLQSGGLDSEVMIKSFMAADIPFTPTTFRFPDQLNVHELNYVNRFNAVNNLRTYFYDIDFVKWVKTREAADYWALSNCWSVAMLPHMKLLHHIWFDLGGMPVLGGGDVVIIKRQDGWYFSKYEHMLAWYWFCTKHDIEAGVAFFQHTPEIILSMLQHPLIQRTATGKDALANKLLPDARAVKYRVYHELWPELQRRIKFGGTELVYGMVSKREEELRSLSPRRYDDIWGIPYGDAVAALQQL